MLNKETVETWPNGILFKNRTLLKSNDPKLELNERFFDFTDHL